MEPEDVLQALQDGWDYHSELTAQDIEKKKGGCGCCGNSLLPCTFNILVALQYRYDLGVYDETTEKLYQLIILLTS